MITTTVGGQNDWSVVDAENFSKFLGSDTGQRFLMRLADSVPPLLDGGHVNKVLIRSGEVRGQTALIQFINSLAHTIASPVAPADAYPSLDDDRMWPDGNDEAEIKSAPTPE